MTSRRYSVIIKKLASSTITFQSIRLSLLISEELNGLNDYPLRHPTPLIRSITIDSIISAIYNHKLTKSKQSLLLTS